MRIKRIIKPLFFSFLIPPKIGRKAAKYGVKAIQKGARYLIRTEEKQVLEIGIEDFKKMMISAGKKIVLNQEEINRINVFPVADKDTGYNLAATLLGVEGTIYRKNYPDLRELVKDIKEAAMMNARGNAGMIFTGYFIEVLDRIKHLRSIDSLHLAIAMKKGIKAAENSIAEPVEGTILDTIKAAGNASYNAAKIKKEKNIIKVLTEARKASETALRETKEKLAVLKENDVVDAGALGFLKIIEAWIESLKGIEIKAGPESGIVVQPQTEEKMEYKYEVISVFKKSGKIDLNRMKKELSLMGDSLDIIKLDDKIKFHIHTNQPEAIRQKFRIFSEAEFKVEELLCSFPPFSASRLPLGLVSDEVADLPEEILNKYQIEEVPLTARFSDGEIVRSRQEIYFKMREALKKRNPLPTTSAPTFKDFFSTYQKSLEKFEKILVITVSSKFSGTYSSARIARSIFKKPTKLNIYVFDCDTAEAAEGLITVKAAELISRGKLTEEVVEYLKDFCPKVTLIACIDDFRYAIYGGRLKLPKILIVPLYFIQKMGIRILFGIKNGKVRFFGVTLGKNVAKILSGEINKQRKGRKIRVAIAHADNRIAADNLKLNLEKNPDIEVLFVSSVSPVVGTHTGPGAVLAAFHPLD